MKTACVSTFDSFLRANRILSTALSRHGVACDHFVMRVRMDQISDEQIVSILGEPARHVLGIQETIAMLLQEGYDWVILSAENSSCRRFFEILERTDFPRPRPLVATIYPGILFRHHYDGFSARMPADLVILNSRKDCERFDGLRRTFGDFPDNAFELGPVTNLGTEGFVFDTERRNVIFFDQPSVPVTREEKLHIFDELSRLSELHPHLDFCVKLRVSPKEATLHKGGHGTLSYLDEFNRKLPAGRRPLKLVDGSPRALIAGSCLALSVSSTALVEALACGCPAIAIADFGIDEDYGGAFFINSGISGLLEDLDPGNPPVVATSWIEDHVGDADRRMPALVSRMAGDLAAHRERPRPAHPIHPFYGSAAFYQKAVRSFGPGKAISRRYRHRQGAVLVKYALNFIIRRFRGLFRFRKH